ncbi:MAG: thiamine diphosphokinase [Bacillota bacterium]|nr:thiamine diphosphokinase [Bacillota bacterium]
MKKLLIITSYVEYPVDISSRISPDHHILCTDGGYDIAVKLGLRPDILVGDFDSIMSPVPGDIEIKRFNPEKDYTDLQLALETAVESGFDAVEIYGGMGGRLDHTVANLQIMSQYSDSFAHLTMFDGRNQCFILNGAPVSFSKIPRREGCYLSLFSLSESCIVTVSGVKYTLTDHLLTRSFPLGVSNEFCQKEAALQVKDGTLLVVISKDAR